MMNRRQIRFLALGDSYTIGESIAPQERWPVQLAAALREQGKPTDEPVLVARTGWTTGELMSAIDQAGVSGPFDLVSLMIGVNNQYRRLEAGQYRLEFQALLQKVINYAGGDPSRVIALSIPDWGVTPFAQGQDRTRITAEIDHFNQVNREEARRAEVHYIDVTPLSRQTVVDPALIAADGLHPSGKMYTRWVKLVLPVALRALK